MNDAVVPCSRCNGDRVVRIGRDVVTCGACDGIGLVPSLAFRAGPRRATASAKALDLAGVELDDGAAVLFLVEARGGGLRAAGAGRVLWVDHDRRLVGWRDRDGADRVAVPHALLVLPPALAEAAEPQRERGTR